MFFAAALSALSLVSAVSAQVVVQVGAESTTSGGIFQFIPPTVTAKNGTTVTFKFTGAPGNHTVTQSTFADPCDPAAGGFDSGWVFIPASPALTETPEWNLTITDDTKPLWFFCKQLAPSPHCKAGMVGAINAPTTGNNTFANYQKNAVAFSGTPGQGQNGLVGNGASASAGIGPVPSGAITYAGVPLASGSAASPSATAPGGSAAGSGSGAPAATNTPASGASTIAASTISVLIAAVAGFSLA
ncbi:hypothetical protein BDZ97DRAFT_1724511 [Flammula alnicola]|nr:hypothetical protein BDZ97DRAFT_1724511 [Flammula alnicola]